MASLRDGDSAFPTDEERRNPAVAPATVRGYGWDWCHECNLWRPKGGPPHNASPRCKSGGYSHCSCDTCF